MKMPKLNPFVVYSSKSSIDNNWSEVRIADETQVESRALGSGLGISAVIIPRLNLFKCQPKFIIVAWILADSPMAVPRNVAIMAIRKAAFLIYYFKLL